MTILLYGGEDGLEGYGSLRPASTGFLKRTFALRLCPRRGPVAYSFVTMNGVVVGCSEPPAGSTVTAIAAAFSIGPGCI